MPLAWKPCSLRSFASLGPSAADFVQLGRPPNRIDLITSFSGVSFEEAWEGREYGDLDGVKVPTLYKKCLRRNKAATGRDQERNG